ncbi:MAG: hypothetical protein OXK80_03920 [Bdellovibrionales bacterium]|nr:hypothetical protein [Bdellovibrionales bacterium]
MFIFRILDFIFRLFTTVMLVLILQISVGGKTLEDYLMSFIQTSNSLAPVRDIAYSSVRRINPNVQIKEVEKRSPASISPSGQGGLLGLKTDFFGEILKTVLSQYTHLMKDMLKSTQGIEEYPVNVEKEIDKVTEDVKKKDIKIKKPSSASAKEKASTQ